MVSTTILWGTTGYSASEVFLWNSGKVLSKSDIYSIGMLLYEIVGARDRALVRIETSEAYFLQWVFFYLENRRDIRSQIKEGGK